MQEVITGSFLELLIIAPILLLSIDWKQPKKQILLGLFVVFYILNRVLIKLPYEFPNLNFASEFSWNWSGKTYAIIGSLIFYFSFRNYFSKNNFLHLKQAKGSVRKNVIAVIVITAVCVLMGPFLFSPEALDIETLSFQLTMPGVDEEIAFRGIMMGLLASVLKDKIGFKKLTINPTIWVVGILFGLAHGIQLNEWNISMDWMWFSYTFLYGLVLGWMTIRSKSILMPLLSHLSTNFMITLVTMIR